MSDHADCVEIGECATDCSERKPRSWSLPPEPGPEVRAVRVNSHRYTREVLADEDWDWWWIEGGISPASWNELIVRGYTITDATHELEES